MKQFEGKKIYLGADTHKRSLDLKILTEHTIQKSIHFQPVCPDAIVRFLRANYDGAEFYCAYESGFSGFWLQEALEKRGVNTIVVHAADIPSSDKDKRFKTDKLDAKKIAFCLRAGLLQSIYIPEKKQQVDRTVVRSRYKVAKDTRRIKSRIKSHLLFFGIQIPWEEGVTERYWSNRMIANIETYASKKQDLALLLMIEELRMLRKLQAKALRNLREMAKKPRYHATYQNLVSIPGVGPLTAMTVLTEIGLEVERFKSIDALSSYCGLVPGSHSSGERTMNNRISTRGNRHLKNALILSAWMSIRYDKHMLSCYENYRQRMIAQKAIIKVAKKQLNRIHAVLKSKTKFITKK